jgi:HEAT repeat protein
MKKISLTLLTVCVMACLVTLVASADEQKAIGVLRSTAGQTRKEAACRELKQIGTAAAVPALASLLTDEHLCQWALDVLETMPCAEASEALLAALGTTSSKSKAGVVHALGQRRERKALPELVRLLGDPDPLVASAAALALCRIGGEKAVEGLRKAQAGAPAPVRGAIVNAMLNCADRLLSEGDPKAASALYEELYASKEPDHVRVAAYRGIVLSSGERAVSLIASALKGNDTAAQLASVQLVPVLNDKVATKTFADLLSGISVPTQIALLDALSRRGDSAACPAVVAAARGADPAVRAAALRALSDLGDASHVPLLAEAAAAGTEPERQAARQALARLRPADVCQALLDLIEKSRAEVQVELIEALASRNERQAIPALLNLTAKPDTTVSVAAIQAVQRMADESQANALLGLIVRASSDPVREAARSAFVSVASRLKRRDAFAALALKAMPGADIAARCALLQTAGQLGGPGVLEAIRAGAGDANQELREAAIRTMADYAGAEAMGDLLALARQSSSPAHRSLALGGYWRVVGLMKNSPAEDRLKACQDGWSVSDRPEDKRVALAELATVALPAALDLAERARADEAVKADAEAACYQVAVGMVAMHRAAAEAGLRRLAGEAVSERVRKDASAAVAALDKHADYVIPWMVCSPYRQAGKQAQQLFDIAFPPEQPGATGVTWRPQPAPVDIGKFWEVDLSSVVGDDHCVVYLKTKVFSPQAQAVSLEIGSDDGIKLWVNGRIVHANNAVRGFAPGQDRAKASLKQGWNDFLAKITQHTLGCEMAIRITAADGSPIQGLRFDARGE